MEQKAYYAIIPANVRYDKDLQANAKLLYGEITALCNEKGYCWASNQYFADLYGVSIRSVERWINALVCKGYVYRKMVYEGDSKDVEKRILSLDPGDKNVMGGCQNCHDPGDKNVMDNNTYINNTFNNTYKEKNIKKESIKDIVTNYTDNTELVESLESFVDMRKQMKKPLTDRAMKLSLKTLDKLALDDFTKIDIVNQSIEHGWLTFYALQSNKQKTREEMGFAF